jgi:hypothetical protein
LQNHAIRRGYIRAIGALSGNKDISGGAVGWQGLDIKKNENWRKWLYIHQEDKTNGFNNWENSKDLNNSTFESISTHKGTFGTTIFYKSTENSFKTSPIGQL